MLQSVTELLQDVTESYGAVTELCRPLRKHCGLLQNVTQVLWNPYGKYRFYPHGPECTRPIRASCTMPTADEFSYSADGTLHSHYFSPLSH